MMYLRSELQLVIPAEPRLARWWRAVVIALLTVVIVGHGCHRGDHDEEPVVTPPLQQSD